MLLFLLVLNKRSGRLGFTVALLSNKSLSLCFKYRNPLNKLNFNIYRWPFIWILWSPYPHILMLFFISNNKLIDIWWAQGDVNKLISKTLEANKIHKYFNFNSHGILNIYLNTTEFIALKYFSLKTRHTKLFVLNSHVWN